MFLGKLGERGGEGRCVVNVYTCGLQRPHEKPPSLQLYPSTKIFQSEKRKKKNGLIAQEKARITVNVFFFFFFFIRYTM